MSSHVGKELAALRRLAEEQGWTVEPMKHHHLRWTAPDGQWTGSARTPSDHHGLMNLRADLRRLGLLLPSKDGRKVER